MNFDFFLPMRVHVPVYQFSPGLCYGWKISNSVITFSWNLKFYRKTFLEKFQSKAWFLRKCLHVHDIPQSLRFFVFNLRFFYAP